MTEKSQMNMQQQRKNIQEAQLEFLKLIGYAIADRWIAVQDPIHHKNTAGSGHQMIQ
jgi:hypothetical protein